MAENTRAENFLLAPKCCPWEQKPVIGPGKKTPVDWQTRVSWPKIFESKYSMDGDFVGRTMYYLLRYRGTESPWKAG